MRTMLVRWSHSRYRDVAIRVQKLFARRVTSTCLGSGVCLNGSTSDVWSSRVEPRLSWKRD
jgi:hypothetical protein